MARQHINMKNGILSETTRLPWNHKPKLSNRPPYFFQKSLLHSIEQQRTKLKQNKQDRQLEKTGFVMKADKIVSVVMETISLTVLQKTKRRKMRLILLYYFKNWRENADSSTIFHKKAICNWNGKTNEIKPQKVQQQSLYGLLDWEFDSLDYLIKTWLKLGLLD